MFSYYIFYRLLLVARGTRAMQVAAGLVIISLLYAVAQLLRLQTITALVGSLLQSIILVVVVVFQNDIRRALQRVGSRANFAQWSRGQESEVIEEVVEAARELARHRIGALITFEQDAHLDEFIGQNKGITLDAAVSAELLVSLFIPESENKLHDGAVILQNLRIAKAGVFFPMPQGKTIDNKYGSRHRAALGITEETDAVVVVVSEERGTLSFCYKGNIASDLQASQLRDMLRAVMSPKSVRPQPSAAGQPVPRTTEAGDVSSSEQEQVLTSVSLETPVPMERLLESVEQLELQMTPEPLRRSIPPKSERSISRPELGSQQPLSERPPASRKSSDEAKAPLPLRKSRLPASSDTIIPEPDLATRASPRPMPKAKARELIPDSAADDTQPTDTNEERQS